MRQTAFDWIKAILLVGAFAAFVLVCFEAFLHGAEAPQRFDESAFADFMQYAASFERKLDGCPHDAYDQRQCVASLGKFDAQLKERVWRKGAALFAGK